MEKNSTKAFLEFINYLIPVNQTLIYYHVLRGLKRSIKVTDWQFSLSKDTAMCHIGGWQLLDFVSGKQKIAAIVWNWTQMIFLFSCSW